VLCCLRPEIKEVKLRPVTEKADYDTKVKQAQKFLSKGAKVKLTMTFSGREMRFKDQGKEMMLVGNGAVGWGLGVQGSGAGVYGAGGAQVKVKKV
jgi:hypothetical protein